MGMVRAEAEELIAGFLEGAPGLRSARKGPHG